jgi:class 3 adenylate cyclase
VKISVRLKLVLFSSVIALLAGGMAAGFAIYDTHRASQARIDAQLEQLASLVATGGVFADGGGGIDGRALRAFVHNAAAMRLPVAYVLVEDGEGAMDPGLSAVNVQVLRELSPELSRAWAEGREVDAVLERLGAAAGLGRSHRSLAVNLQGAGGESLGRLRVGMSSVEADRQLQAALVTSGAIVGGLLLVVLFLAAVAAGRLVRPVQRLSEAMARVAEGDLDQDLPPTSSDEIGHLTAAFNAMTSGLRQRERLRATLGRYVSSDVAERILEEADDLDIHGEVRPVSVLFLDIRGFTTLSERLAPREVVELLNSYFEIIVRSVLRHDGIINKFIGDAIMAVWGAPKSQPDHAWQAVAAAWEIQRGIGAFNWERMKQGRDVIHAGIGINTGEAIAGNVGTAERLEYTVIGDEVNLAQRLESIAKPGQILVSAATYVRIDGRVAANALEPVKVKGREKPVTPYEITDLVESGGAAGTRSTG